MVASGAIPERPRVELWEGLLVEKMGRNPPHNTAMRAINAALVRAVPEGWTVGPECSLRLSDDSVPEPDLTVARGGAFDYSDRHPTPADVGLVVEITDSSLDDDLGPVRDAYAAAGVPAYWVVDLPAGRIVAHTDPVGGEAPAYREVRPYTPDQAIPLVLDGRVVAELRVASLLPPRPTA
jgi:Uma2 family endonuclease